MSLKWQAGHAENIYVLYNHFGDIRVKKAVLEKKKKNNSVFTCISRSLLFDTAHRVTCRDD